MNDLSTATAQTDYTAYGEGFIQILAIMSDLPDEGWEACPQDWRALAGHLHILLLDQGLSPTVAAMFAGVPVSFVEAFVDARGI